MTHLLLLFFATFSAAFVATAPPGLLNMNAAKISVEKGKLNGVMFSLGVSVMVVVQATIGVFISKYLHNNPSVVQTLLQIAVVVFAFLAVFFFVRAKKNTIKVKKKVKIKKRNSFYKGLFLTTVNLLTIPYYSGLNAMWKASGWINFEASDILVFVLAAGLGTFAILYLYVFYFNKMDTKSKGFSKNSNYILSALMVLLLLITLFRLFK